MSYSFNVTAASKEAAKAEVASKFAEIVSGQPIHERDNAGAVAAANAMIDLLSDPTEESVVVVVMSGYLSWMNEDTFTGASVKIDANIRPKPVESA